jgi:hypothetical protein
MPKEMVAQKNLIIQSLQQPFLGLLNNLIRIQSTYIKFDDEDDEENFIQYRKDIITDIVRNVCYIIDKPMQQ